MATCSPGRRSGASISARHNRPRLARERPDSAALRAIRAEQAAADAEIDQLVYGLYGLAPDEIAMVEQSCGCSENSAVD